MQLLGADDVCVRVCLCYFTDRIEIVGCSLAFWRLSCQIQLLALNVSVWFGRLHTISAQLSFLQNRDTIKCITYNICHTDITTVHVIPRSDQLNLRDKYTQTVVGVKPLDLFEENLNTISCLWQLCNKSSCVCGDNTRYFKQSEVLFLTLTKWVLH